MEEKNEEKIRIMIADDFPLLLEDMCELIDKQSDMEVVGTANSGKRIVELAKETEFDIILMDIEMENLNAGITATEEIREQLGNASIIFLCRNMSGSRKARKACCSLSIIYPS